MLSDCWFVIYNYIDSIKDGLKIKLICKESNHGFIYYIKNIGTKNNVFPRRTFIKMSTCMCCENTCEKIHMIPYKTDNYPFRKLYYCNKWTCFSSCIGKYLNDMNNESCYPFLIPSNNLFNIKRTSGNYSLGIIQKNAGIYFKENGIYTIAEFEDKEFVDKLNIYENVLFNPFLSKCILLNTVEYKINIYFYNYWKTEIRNFLVIHS